jgi:hypothetical protein
MSWPNYGEGLQPTGAYPFFVPGYDAHPNLVLREYRNLPYEAVLYGWEKIRVNSGNQQTEFLQARAIWPPERK